MAQCFWQNFNNAQCFSLVSLEAPQKQIPVNIIQTKKMQLRKAGKLQREKCAFKEKLKV